MSVVADLCLVAGSTATIALLREEEGPRWLEQMEVTHLFIDLNGQAGGSLLSML